MPAISLRTCRHCGAVLLEGEREDECSGAFNAEHRALLERRASFARSEFKLRRVGKGALCAVAAISVRTKMVGSLRSAHPTKLPGMTAD